MKNQVAAPMKIVVAPMRIAMRVFLFIWKGGFTGLGIAVACLATVGWGVKGTVGVGSMRFDGSPALVDVSSVAEPISPVTESAEPRKANTLVAIPAKAEMKSPKPGEELPWKDAPPKLDPTLNALDA